MRQASLIFFLIMIQLGRADILSLRDAQGLLLKNNLDVLTAEEEVAKASNELTGTYASYWPSLDVTGSYNYLTEKSRLNVRIPSPLPGASPIVIDKTMGGNDRAECGLNLSYPFFTGFQRYYAVMGKKEVVAIKQATLEGTKNRASLNLGQLYLQWELSYKQVLLRQALVEQLETYTKQLVAMLESGTIQRSKLLDAQARLQLARVDVEAAKDQGDSLGLEIKAMLLLKDASIGPDTSGMVFDTLPVPKVPKTTRPELVALDHATAQVEAMRASLKFRHFLVISGLAGLRYGRPGLNLGRDAYMGYGLVGVQAQWNLFDGFKVQTEKELIERQINFIDIERTRQTEFFSRSFTLARQQFRSAGNRLMAAESARDAAEALAEDCKNSLSAGTITNAEYLTALVNLAQARLLVEQVRTMKKMALLKVMYTAGIIIIF